jgi:hypothetical protein
VIVWRDDSANNSDEAVDFIATITRFSVSEERDELFAFENWENRDMAEHAFSRLPWKALIYFFARSYWHRL